MNSCEKCGNADNFDWEEIQKGKPWLVKCLECGHSWTETPEKRKSYWMGGLRKRLEGIRRESYF